VLTRGSLRSYEIEVIPGDGIGPEVIWAGAEVLGELQRRAQEIAAEVAREFPEVTWDRSKYTTGHWP
jgi:isocitrate/isopropylmalate dehydrogenase